jgi:alpha-ribazole phosphatase
MCRVYLIRHGETQLNREQTFRGRLDVPLNDRGRAQARAVGERLAAENLSAVYCSPLARARETAEAVADSSGLTALPDDTLMDMDFGEWQGLTLASVEEQYPEIYRTWATAPEAARVPGGETLADVLRRAGDGLRILAERYHDETVAVVTHRVVLKLLLARALGLDERAFWRIRQDTACINLIEVTGDRTVVCMLNDTCHLRNVGGEALPDF